MSSLNSITNNSLSSDYLPFSFDKTASGLNLSDSVNSNSSGNSDSSNLFSDDETGEMNRRLALNRLEHDVPYVDPDDVIGHGENDDDSDDDIDDDSAKKADISKKSAKNPIPSRDKPNQPKDVTKSLGDAEDPKNYDDTTTDGPMNIEEIAGGKRKSNTKTSRRKRLREKRSTTTKRKRVKSAKRTKRVKRVKRAKRTKSTKRVKRVKRKTIKVSRK